MTKCNRRGQPNEKYFMPLQICRCCAGRMTMASASNPNICVGCEQLLADDGAELDGLLRETASGQRQETGEVSTPRFVLPDLARAADWP